MAHRATRRPCVTVVISACDAEKHIGRAVESLLTQDFRDFQLIVADCGSADRTADIAERMGERDIRIDVLRLDACSLGRGRDAALEAARGSYILFMDGDDWLAPHALAPLVEAAQERRLALAVPAISFDEQDAHGTRSTRVAGCLSGTFASQVGAMIDNNLMESACGKLFVRSEMDEACLSFGSSASDLFFMAAYLEHVGSAVGFVPASCIHVVAAAGAAPAFDARQLERIEREHVRVLEMLHHLGLDEDRLLVMAAHRRHFQQISVCIEDICANSRSLSSIERTARIRDIVDAPSTCETVAQLREVGRDLGLMYSPVAHRNVTAVCMSGWISGMLKLTERTAF